MQQSVILSDLFVHPRVKASLSTKDSTAVVGLLRVVAVGSQGTRCASYVAHADTRRPPRFYRTLLLTCLCVYRCCRCCRCLLGEKVVFRGTGAASPRGQSVEAIQQQPKVRCRGSFEAMHRERGVSANKRLLEQPFYRLHSRTAAK